MSNCVVGSRGLGLPGGTVAKDGVEGNDHFAPLSLRQHHDIETVLQHIDSTKALLSHPHVPSLLMRDRTLATVREWKKRLEHQAHWRLSPRRLGASSRNGDGVVNRPPVISHYALFPTTRRREVLGLIGGAAAPIWAQRARAQSSNRLLRVGLVSSTDPRSAPQYAAIDQRLSSEHFEATALATALFDSGTPAAELVYCEPPARLFSITGD